MERRTSGRSSWKTSTEMLAKVQDKIDPTVLISDFFRKNDVTLEIRIKVKEKTGDGV